MSWVRQTTEEEHQCEPPIVKDWGEPGVPIDSLWRCDERTCRKLWRVAAACDSCDANGGRHDFGQCTVGTKWRPGTLWQRLRFRGRG